MHWTAVSEKKKRKKTRTLHSAQNLMMLLTYRMNPPGRPPLSSQLHVLKVVSCIFVRVLEAADKECGFSSSFHMAE